MAMARVAEHASLNHVGEVDDHDGGHDGHEWQLLHTIQWVLTFEAYDLM